MSQSTSSGRSRRPTLGLVAVIAGALGVLLCVLAIVAMVTGRTWVQERVDVLQNGAQQTLEQAIAVGDQAIEGLQAGSQTVTEIKTQAESLAANPALDEVALNALQQRLAPLSERYGNLRERYVTFREKATTFGDTVRRLERLVPGLDLPEAPGDLVNTIDEVLTGLDQAANDISSRAAERSGASATATAIATAATRLEEGLANATQLATNIRANVAEMEDSVKGVTDHVGMWLTYGTAAGVLFFLWILVLNLALIALGRRWRAA
jgi:chromosome segregation ATPase